MAAESASPSNGRRPTDLDFMRMALALARRGLGAVWPNPAVGCVLVADGAVIGRGWTGPGGRPHAETEALRRASRRVSGAAAYVSLEPCSHWGRTPPCTEALIGAGLRRVVVAAEDPDPRVNGAGLARLRAAGIAVELGLAAPEALEINAGFFSRIQRGRPLVTVKLATTLDGRIAMPGGESRWITGVDARARAHLLRTRYDAIMVGIGTALADDPELTCRLPGLEARSPVRVVVDRQLRLKPTARLVAGVGAPPSWVLTAHPADPARRAMLEAGGASVIDVEASADQFLAAALEALAARGITRLLVEGGAGLAAALVEARLVDRLAWFHAPRLIGGDGVPAIAALGCAALAEAPAFDRISTETVGEDVLTMLRIRDR